MNEGTRFTLPSPFAVIASVLEREPWSIPYAEAWPLVGAALRATERGNP